MLARCQGLPPERQYFHFTGRITQIYGEQTTRELVNRVCNGLYEFYAKNTVVVSRRGWSLGGSSS